MKKIISAVAGVGMLVAAPVAACTCREATGRTGWNAG